MGDVLSSKELLPCPFCGKKATFDTNGSLTWVFCYHCDSRGSRVHNGRQAKKKAADAWNRRADDE